MEHTPLIIISMPAPTSGKGYKMIFTYEQVYKARKKAVTQNSNKDTHVRLKYQLEQRLTALLVSLESGTFQPAPLTLKNIYIPKKRVAQVPSVMDKIVQHTICDNYLYDALTKPLVKETSSCLKGRGTHYAVDLIKEQLRKHYRKRGKEFYALKCDIKSYFASISHDGLWRLIERYVADEDIKKIMQKYIALSDCGLALGLQQSQLLANLYLSPLDHYCKEYLRADKYNRHMDDFCIISHDREYLENCLAKIEPFINRQGLTLNPKTKITHNKINYLGFTFYIDERGKAVQRLISGKKRTKKRHIRMMMREVLDGERTVEKFVSSYMSWRCHALSGDCYKMIAEWDDKIKVFLNSLGYDWKIKGNKVKLYVTDFRTT